MVETYRLIWGVLTRAERRRFVGIMLLTLVMAVFEVVGIAGILPFLTVLSRPELIGTHWALVAFAETFGLATPQAVMVGLGLAVFVLMALSMVVRAAVSYVQVRFALMRAYSLATRLLQGHLARDYVWHLSRNSAETSQALLSEVDLVVRESILPAVLLVAQVITLLMLGGLLFAVEPAVALGATALLGGVYILAYVLLRTRLTRAGRLKVAANRARFQTAQEIMGGIKEIKAMGLEAASLGRFRKPAAAMARHQTTGLVIGKLPRFALEGVVYGGFIAMVIVMIVLRGGAVADLMPLLGLLALAATRMFPALQQLYKELTSMRFSQPALKRLHAALTDLPPAEPAAPPGPALRLADRLEIDGLTFRYPGAERDTIAGLSASIPARSTVGIVGGTGAGKTTLVDLILGLLVPDAGAIRVDGTAVTPERRRAWQRSIGYVPQAIFLADDTVAANIAFGEPEAAVDMARVEAAARTANLHDFVTRELPQGYATFVGERGVRLSGGQRQRIGIARALYRDPDVLILDEATSALDTLTERAVMEAVHTLAGQKTVIMIAHRLTTVKDCDMILMLERGRVVAQGRFDDLVAGNDTFRRMAGE